MEFSSLILLFGYFLTVTATFKCNSTSDCSNHGGCNEPYAPGCFCDDGYYSMRIIFVIILVGSEKIVRKVNNIKYSYDLN